MKKSNPIMLLTLSCFVLISCQDLEENIPAPMPTQTPVSTLSLSTETPIPSLTFPPTLTATLENLPTPVPTLNPNDAQSFLLNLLETNGNCKLPCWWGSIVPGKSKWVDVDNFLQSFSDGVELATKKNGLFHYGATFTVPETIRVEKKLIVAIDVRDGIVEQIFLGQPYPLNKLLVDYGKPTDIQITIGDEIFEEFSSEGQYTIILFWRDQGILAADDGKVEKIKPLRICMNKLDKGGHPAFWLWDPARKRTIEEVAGNSGLFGSAPFQRKFHSLKEVLDIDIETFYQTYLDPANANTCFNISDTYSPYK